MRMDLVATLESAGPSDKNNVPSHKVGALLVINGLITPITRVITPVIHL